MNACRVCVVEVEGARVLAPACSRKVESGMKVKTHSPRVDRRARWCSNCSPRRSICRPRRRSSRRSREYGADPALWRRRDRRAAGQDRQRPLHPRLRKCVLCYKCVEACGIDAQNTFAIAVAGRGFHAHISTELDVPLPESACVYCGNCIAVCPTGALMAKPEFDLRAAGEWGPGDADRSPTPSARIAASAARSRCTSRTSRSSRSRRRSTTR